MIKNVLIYIKPILNKKKWVLTILLFVLLGVLLFSCRDLKNGYYLRFFAPYYNGKPIYDAEFFRFKVLQNGFATDEVVNVYKGFTFSHCQGLRILDERFAADDCHGYIYRQNGRITRLPNSDGKSLALVGGDYVQEDSFKAFFDDGQGFVTLSPMGKLILVNNSSQYDATDTWENYFKGNFVGYTEKYLEQERTAENTRKEIVKNCEQYDLLTLIVSKDGEEQKIFTEYNHSLSVERFENKLYFVEDNDKVVQYDIFSGEKITIFTIESAGLNGRRGDEGISIDLIGNSLFVSVGGYLVDGKFFAFRLPNIDDPIFISGGHNLGIKQELGRYFISGGDGDAGWSFNDLALFDIDIYKVSPFIYLQSDMGAGKELIGFSENGYLVSDQHLDSSMLTVIDKIYYADYRNPSKITTLLSDKKMPEIMIDSSLDKSGENLFLLASSTNLYVYNLKDGNLSKVKDNISNNSIVQNIYNISNVEDDFICLNGVYRFGLKTNSMEKIEHGCLPFTESASLKDKILEMKLPEEFRYECSSRL